MAPADAPRTLVSVDRQGRETPIAPPGGYLFPGYHPMARVSRCTWTAPSRISGSGIWRARRSTRLTSEPGVDANALWTPDGRRLLFRSDRAGSSNLFVQNADGTGPPGA